MRVGRAVYDGDVGKRKRHSAAKPGASADWVDDDNPMDRFLAELGTTIAAGDVLNAEIDTSALIGLVSELDHSAAEIAQVAAGLVAVAESELDGPEGAAYLRLLMSLGPRAVKRKASEALAGFTGDGVYPPEWVTSIGRPTPERAWRVYDVTGDREVVAVTYRYEDAEHALLVGIDLVELPVAIMIVVAEDADAVIKTLRDNAEPWERLEQITMAEARRRLEPAFALAEEESAFDRESALFLPLAKSRLRRLPSDDPGQAVVYTAADRAAAVDEFLRSAEGADAGDPETARFWAQALTGYSSRVPGEPPAQVGPARLSAMLLLHVAGTFTLSAELRDGLRPAVTAWVRWAAVHQGLDEAATQHLTERVPMVLSEFPIYYDDPYSAVERGYVRDLVAGDTDVAWLAEQRARREFAVPLPDERDESVADVDAADPEGRAVVTAAEFRDCGPAGADGEKFVAAAGRVVEEIWNNEPAQTWQEAGRLAATGLDRHDVIHALAGDAHGARG